MKWSLAIITLVLFVSCRSGTGKTAASDSANATQAVINTADAGINNPENASGAKLIAANDCLGCHAIDRKNTGPSYQEIANRYQLNQGNIENLAHRIIKGGKGLWGDAAMTPHPALSYQQAEEMVRYILSLRNLADTLK